MIKWLITFSILWGQVQGQEPTSFKYQHPQMGTVFRVILIADQASTADIAAENAFSRLDQLNQILSDYLPDSEVNLLDNQSGDGAWHAVSTDLWTVLKISKQIFNQSGGAFDVTVGPLSRLWRRAFRRQYFPNKSDLDQAKVKVNSRYIRIKKYGTAVKLKHAGMELDFGGIGKGYALDQMAEIFRTSGINQFLIDGGGDILCGAAPPNDIGWKVQLPNDSILILENQAIATSGDRYQFLEQDGIQYSHLIDPRTGYGIQDQETITVITEKATQADAWASAFSILSSKERVHVLRRRWGKSLQLFTFKT